MHIETKYFGAIEIHENEIINFEEGIFGFDEYKKYIIIFENESKETALCWLQAIEEKELSLPMINPYLVIPEYSPDIPDLSINKLGDMDIENLSVFTIVVVPNDVKNMTTNLMAPIVINHKTKQGIQVIIEDNRYQIKHNLYDYIQKINKKAGE